VTPTVTASPRSRTTLQPELAAILAAAYLRLLATRTETAPSHGDDRVPQIRVALERDKSVNVLENSGESDA
jgi:hypothetical protein